MTSQKRIHAIVNFMGHRGSGIAYSLEMTRGLLECGCSVTAIICSDAENIQNWKELPLTDLILVKTGDHYSGAIKHTFTFLAKDARKAFDRAMRIKPDFFYVPMVSPLSVVFENMFRRAGIPTVFTLHDVNPHQGERTLGFLPVHWAARRLARKSTFLTILTENFRNETARKHGRSPESILITRHGVFRELQATAIEPKAPMATVNFLFFGRIVDYKGIGLLCNAYTALDRECAPGEISLRIVGSGDMRPYTPMLAGARNVCIDNRFVDAEEILPLLRMKGTVVVLPYVEASQSGVIPQAMQENAPLIISDMKGLLEQTEGGKLAIVCRPTSESLLDAMRKAKNNPGILHDNALKAGEHVKKLEWSVIAAELLKDLSLRQ